LLVDPHHRGRRPLQSGRNLAVALAVLAAELLVERHVRSNEETLDRIPDPLEQARIIFGRWQIGFDDIAVYEQCTRIDHQIAVAIIDPGAQFGRGDQTPHQRRDLLRIDRKVERRGVVAVFVAGRLLLQKLFRIDMDRASLDGGRACDGAGHDLALGEQSLDLEVDQAFTKLVEIEDADDQRHETGEIENDDTPGQARKCLQPERTQLAPDAPAQGRGRNRRLGIVRISLGGHRFLACGVNRWKPSPPCGEELPRSVRQSLPHASLKR